MEALEFLVWMLVGALIGSLHCYLPKIKRDPATIWTLAIAGAIVGGWLGRLLLGRTLGVGDFSTLGIVLAAAGAELLLQLERALRKPPRSTGA